MALVMEAPASVKEAGKERRVTSSLALRIASVVASA
jgi:hypothetical protein